MSNTLTQCLNSTQMSGNEWKKILSCLSTVICFAEKLIWQLSNIYCWCATATHVVYCIKVKKPRVQLPYYNYKVYLVFSKKVKNLYTASKITWTLKTMLPSTYFLKYLCLGNTDQYIQCVHASDISSSRPSYSLPKQSATVKNCCIMVNKVWNVSN